MISRLVVKNFKSIGEPGVDLELKPLTILVGPNGSGKSSIFEAVAFAAQGFSSGNLFETQHNGDIHRHSEELTLQIVVYLEKIPAVYREYTQTRFTNPGVHWMASGDPVGNRDTIRHLDEIWREEMKDTFVLSTTRGKIATYYQAIGSPNWVGKEGESLVSLLTIIFGRREYEAVEMKINRWAPKFGIEALSAGYWGNERLGSDYRDPIIGNMLELAVSSAGARQVMSIITQLIWASPRSITIIEEPEISLHPESQLRLIDLFAEVIQDQKQILITTHSPILLMALSRAVRKGNLNPVDIAIYHVEKKKETGTVVKRLPVNEKGYIKGWVPSFAKVERDLLSEWVKALPEA